MLTLVYEPGQTTVAKVAQRIAEAGHDTEFRQAPDDVYRKLPECCLYRTGNPDAAHPVFIRGIVLEEDTKGNFNPLPGATIRLINAGEAVQSDSSGIFRIRVQHQPDRLLITYSGYSPDTIAVQPGRDLRIILAADRQLGEVTVQARMRTTYISPLSNLRTQVMTERELFKAACCNLSESFETNPSVDVSYNDAVTGSKQIQLLGLSGVYTQLTVENLQGPRGLATALGLNSIAGPWIESIQLNKGTGSVVNGFESIAGQINVELKQPDNGEHVFANLYVNSIGKTDLNLNLAWKAGKKWSSSLLLHDDFLYNKADMNKDGFRDLPTGNQFSFVNRWKFEDGKGFISQFGVKWLNDQRTGGELSFDPAKDRYSTQVYGLGMDTRRLELFAKNGYVFPGKKYKSIGLQLQAFNYRQDAWFGVNPYTAQQESVFGNFIYQSIIGNSNHKFRTGLSMTADRYMEVFRQTVYGRREQVSGGFFEYTWTPVKAIGLVAGLRADNNNLFGWFITPRIHARYEPVTGTVIRFSAGRGQRTANIFAENTSVLVSARTLVISGTGPGKAYGLNPETAWNKGISVDQRLRLFNRSASVAIDFFRNDFTQQVITDLEQPGMVRFYNLSGKSFSNSLQAEFSLEPVRAVQLRMAYRFFDVRTTYGTRLLQRPNISRHRAFLNLAAERSGWKLDYTVNLNGPRRMPSTAGNPAGYTRATESSAYWLMNAQVSKTIGKKHPVEWYLGAENLTNFMQPDAIIAADQPFSNWFDAAQVWGPVTGRMLYTGLRYKLKKKQ